MRPRRNKLASEQHDPEEARLEKESDHPLVREQRSEDIRAGFGKAAPIGAELERHHDAGHHPHAERHCKHARPEDGQAEIDRIPLDRVQPFEQDDERSKADRECRQQDVKRDDERELKARQQDRIKFHACTPAQNRPRSPTEVLGLLITFLNAFPTLRRRSVITIDRESHQL